MTIEGRMKYFLSLTFQKIFFGGQDGGVVIWDAALALWPKLYAMLETGGKTGSR